MSNRTGINLTIKARDEYYIKKILIKHTKGEKEIQANTSVKIYYYKYEYKLTRTIEETNDKFHPIQCVINIDRIDKSDESDQGDLFLEVIYENYDYKELTISKNLTFLREILPPPPPRYYREGPRPQSEAIPPPPEDVSVTVVTEEFLDELMRTNFLDLAELSREKLVEVVEEENPVEENEVPVIKSHTELEQSITLYRLLTSYKKKVEEIIYLINSEYYPTEEVSEMKSILVSCVELVNDIIEDLKKDTTSALNDQLINKILKLSIFMENTFLSLEQYLLIYFPEDGEIAPKLVAIDIIPAFDAIITLLKKLAAISYVYLPNGKFIVLIPKNTPEKIRALPQTEPLTDPVQEPSPQDPIKRDKITMSELLKESIKRISGEDPPEFQIPIKSNIKDPVVSSEIQASITKAEDTTVKETPEPVEEIIKEKENERKADLDLINKEIANQITNETILERLSYYSYIFDSVVEKQEKTKNTDEEVLTKTEIVPALLALDSVKAKDTIPDIVKIDEQDTNSVLDDPASKNYYAEFIYDFYDDPYYSAYGLFNVFKGDELLASYEARTGNFLGTKIEDNPNLIFSYGELTIEHEYAIGSNDREGRPFGGKKGDHISKYVHPKLKGMWVGDETWGDKQRIFPTNFDESRKHSKEGWRGIMYVKDKNGNWVMCGKGGSNFPAYRIHPDGNKIGSAGCIAIYDTTRTKITENLETKTATYSGTNSKKLRDLLNSILENQKFIPLKVKSGPNRSRVFAKSPSGIRKTFIDVKVGESTIQIRKTFYPRTHTPSSNDVNLLIVHDDERQAINHAHTFMEVFNVRGNVYEVSSINDLNPTYTRHVRFKHSNKIYTVDPNRIFTSGGRLAQCEGNSGAANEIKKLADQILELFKENNYLIVLHNTRGTVTIRNETPQKKPKEVKKANISSVKPVDLENRGHPSNLMFVTLDDTFEYFKSKNYNVSLCVDPLPDGNLPASARGSLQQAVGTSKDYINIEAFGLGTGGGGSGKHYAFQITALVDAVNKVSAKELNKRILSES